MRKEPFSTNLAFRRHFNGLRPEGEKRPRKTFHSANFHSVNCISLLLSYDDGLGSLETTEKVFSVLEDLA